MNELSFEERNLVCIYNSSGNRKGTMDALIEMRRYLGQDETELQELTDSALIKLESMSDADFEALELFPDFDQEDLDAD